MSMQVNVHDAKTNFSRYLNLANAGEEIVVAKAGKPFAKLVPIDSEKRDAAVKLPPREPGGWPGRLTDAFFEPLPPGWDGN